MDEPVRWALLALGAAGVLVLLVGALWLSRTRTLALRVGSFQCVLALSADGPWRRGVAQYGRLRLYWWRRRSLRPRPARVFDRSTIVVAERQELPAAGGAESTVRVRCVVPAAAGGTEDVWLWMDASAWAGFVSWLEAAPTRIGSVI